MAASRRTGNGQLGWAELTTSDNLTAETLGYDIKLVTMTTVLASNVQRTKKNLFSNVV